MGAPSVTKMQVIQAIIEVEAKNPGKPFRSEDIREKIVLLTSQQLTNVMGKFIEANAIARVKQGMFKINDRELLMQELDYELDRNPALRKVQRTRTISQTRAEELNEWIRIGQSLKTLGSPIHKALGEMIRKDIEDTYRELRIAQRESGFRRIYRRDATRRLSRFMDDPEGQQFIESVAKAYSPDNWQHWIDLIVKEIEE